MTYVLFSFWFTLIHVVAYTIAGALALSFSKDIYEGKQRLMTYLRDMKVERESKHVVKWFLLAQVVRGLLLSFVLYPILPLLKELGFGSQFAFITGLLFIYTHLACAAPCPDNIEGFVYLKEQFFSKSTFLRFQAEMLIYTLVAATLVSGFLL